MGIMKITKKIEKDIVDEIIVLIDSREKLPNHITKAFDNFGVKWEVKKLESGDYSAYVPKNEVLGIYEDINLENIICVERKMSAEEISNNLSNQKDRFKREFERATCKIIIMIENITYKDIATNNYKTQLTPKQFLGLLHSFCDTHEAPFIFVDKEMAALFIYNTFKYKIKNLLKYKNN